MLFIFMNTRFICKKSELHHNWMRAHPNIRIGSNFLVGKCVHEERESNIVIGIYGFQDNPLLFPKFFMDKCFVAEVPRQYHPWLILFECKKKKQYITFPFIVGEVTIKNTIHLVKFAKALKYFILSGIEDVQDFYLEAIFSRHLSIIRYVNLFTRDVENSEERNIG